MNHTEPDLSYSPELILLAIVGFQRTISIIYLFPMHWKCYNGICNAYHHKFHLSCYKHIQQCKCTNMNQQYSCKLYCDHKDDHQGIHSHLKRERLLIVCIIRFGYHVCIIILNNIPLHKDIPLSCTSLNPTLHPQLRFSKQKQLGSDMLQVGSVNNNKNTKVKVSCLCTTVGDLTTCPSIHGVGYQ